MENCENALNAQQIALRKREGAGRCHDENGCFAGLNDDWEHKPFVSCLRSTAAPAGISNPAETFKLPSGQYLSRGSHFPGAAVPASQRPSTIHGARQRDNRDHPRPTCCPVSPRPIAARRGDKPKAAEWGHCDCCRCGQISHTVGCIKGVWLSSHVAAPAVRQAQMAPQRISKDPHPMTEIP